MNETQIIVGQVATADGLASTMWLTPGSRRQGHPTLNRGGYYAPAANYLTEQPSEILVHRRHTGRAVGWTRYLTRCETGGLYAVVEVLANRLSVEDYLGDLYLSGDLDGRPVGDTFHDIVLCGIGLVPKSATVGKVRAVVIDADLDRGDWPSRCEHRRLLQDARTYSRERRSKPHRPHVIAEPDEVELTRFAPAPPAAAAPTTLRVSTDLGMIKIDNVPATRSGKRPNLVWRWHGNPNGLEPIGSHVADHGTVSWFKPTRTRAGNEAVALVGEGLLDTARPVYRLGGSWQLLELTAA